MEESRSMHGWVGLDLGCFSTHFDFLKLINLQPIEPMVIVKTNLT